MDPDFHVLLLRNNELEVTDKVPDGLDLYDLIEDTVTWPDPTVTGILTINYGYIGHIWTRPDVRRRGIATRLLVEARARFEVAAWTDQLTPDGDAFFGAVWPEFEADYRRD